MTMTRSQFLASLAGLGAAALGVAACGSDDEDQPPGMGNCAANGTVIAIAANHGHSLTVSKEDVVAAAAKTYDITGGAAHAHMVTISAAQFASLAQSGSLTVVSSSDGTHTHSVTVTCA